jgi:hypothetical protein
MRRSAAGSIACMRRKRAASEVSLTQDKWAVVSRVQDMEGWTTDGSGAGVTLPHVS